MIDRMLFAEALETQKCLDEGVLTSTADANIGSIMGIGFPPYTGGSAQFIVGYEGGRRCAILLPTPTRRRPRIHSGLSGHCRAVPLPIGRGRPRGVVVDAAYAATTSRSAGPDVHGDELPQLVYLASGRRHCGSFRQADPGGQSAAAGASTNGAPMVTAFSRHVGRLRPA